MKDQKHLFLPLATGVYIAALILVANYELNNTALFVVGLTLVYLIAGITYEIKAGKLRFERMAEIGIIALLFQYLVLFV